MSSVEAIVLTSYKGYDMEATDVEVFATMADDMNAIPPEDFIPGTYTGVSAARGAAQQNLGKEWITGSKIARYVGAVRRTKERQWFSVTSFAVLGTSLCMNKI